MRWGNASKEMQSNTPFPRKFKDEARMRRPRVVPKLVISLPLIFLLQPNQTAVDSFKYDVRLTFHRLPLPAPLFRGSKTRVPSKLNLKLGPPGMAKNVAANQNIPKF